MVRAVMLEGAPPLAPDLGLFQVLRDDGSLDPEVDPRLDEALLLRMFRELKKLRLLDARMLRKQRQGKVGFYGTATGQEAMPVAAGLAVGPKDWVFQALRENFIMIVRGFPLGTFLAQTYGNRGDLLKGRQMPSHSSGRAVHHVSWGSCIANQLPQAVGAAWAAKNRGEDAVVLGFVGDGGTSEPDFHAALNFAAVFHVPCVLICQNNHWAISVPTARQTASETIAVKGRAYGVPSVRVDGNDVIALYDVLSKAIATARAGRGPTFIEAVTYRIGAHSSSDDPTRYRSDEEVARWVERDPLQRLRRNLAARGLVTDANEAALESELNDEISRAIDEVEPLGPPDRDTLFDDVYAELPWHLAEQREELRQTPPAPSHEGGGH